MNVDRAYGICLQSYFGGRSESRIRNWEVPVCPVDFMSEYPTINELLGNWDVLTAKRVTFTDATKEIRKLLSTISLERCFDQKTWPRFKFFALVCPDNDIFPVRTVYNGATQNIGINYFTSKEPFWFAGPDIVASILLTGKVPRIQKAIAVVPYGSQEGLRSVSLRGMTRPLIAMPRVSAEVCCSSLVFVPEPVLRSGSRLQVPVGRLEPLDLAQAVWTHR